MASSRLAVALIAATTLVALGAAVGGEASPMRSNACNTSMPATHPVRGRDSFNFGNRGIAVTLPPRAKFVAMPESEPGWAWVQKDGSIRTKVGWWTARGKPHIAGRRIDAGAPPLRADIGDLSHDGIGPFYPSLLYFPTSGCWKITATAGDASFVATVRVVKR